MTNHPGPPGPLHHVLEDTPPHPPEVEGLGGAGGRVVLVHGFTQTLAAWGPVGERLAGRW